MQFGWNCPFCVYFHKQKKYTKQGKGVSNGTMWKKVLVSLIALIAIGFFGFTFFNGGIDAAGTIGNTPNGGVASSLHTGDEVHLGTVSDDVYNVLGQKDGYIYLLKKNSINNTAVNFTAAEAQANAYLSETNFGKLGHLA